MSLTVLAIILLIVGAALIVSVVGLRYMMYRPPAPPTPAELWEANDNPLWR